MKTRILLTILIMIVAPMLFPRNAFACLCEASGSRRKDFESAKKKATSVFKGEAVEVVNGITHGEFPGWRIKLRVDEYWKGPVQREVTFFTGPSDCAAYFVVGAKYLVLAYIPIGNQDLYTDVCMKTGLVRYSAYELSKLGKGKKP